MTVPKTEKLYLDDPYSTVFESAVAGVEEDAEALVVTLDRSLFYPDSGGQLSDRGKLAGLEVIDVTEDDSGVVYHRLQRPSPQATLKTKRVEGLVDWDRRFDHMQQHTGQHVLSRAFIQAGGLYTVSFHMGDDSCTIDLEGQGFDDNVARRAEAIANSIVVANRAVTVKTVPVEQVDRAELRRSIPEGVTDARIVTVEGFDDIPCCGTHVARTGELGVIKVLKSENVRGNQRVYFKVGGRAFADYVEKHDILQNLSNRLTTAPSDIAAKVEKLGAENQRFKKDTRRLSNRLAALEKGAVVAGAVETAGVRLVVHYSTDADAGYLRMLSTEMSNEPRLIAILGAPDGSVVCSASKDVEVDFGRTAVEPAKAIGGSGGGKGGFAQLKLPGGADVAGFVRKVGDDVKASL